LRKETILMAKEEQAALIGKPDHQKSDFLSVIAVRDI
jgi:hypothetical protein